MKIESRAGRPCHVALNLPPRDAIVIGVQATDRDTLEYQPPTKRARRPSWRTILVICLALAVGIVGKLCWDKFVPALLFHYRVMRAQRIVESGAANSINVTSFSNRACSLYPPPESHVRQFGSVVTGTTGASQRDQQAAFDLLTLNDVVSPGEVVWQGLVRTSVSPVIAIVDLRPDYRSSILRSLNGPRLGVSTFRPRSQLLEPKTFLRSDGYVLPKDLDTAIIGPASLDPSDDAILIIPARRKDGTTATLRLVFMAGGAVDLLYSGQQMRPNPNWPK